MKRRILVSGASGLFGTPLCSFLRRHDYDVLGLSRKNVADLSVDLLDRDATHGILDSYQPDFIIHLAALTNVDICESQPQLAYEQNVKTLETIVDWVQGKRTHLISFSTDQVYDGVGIKREDQLTLSNVYAFSKYCGELLGDKVGATNLRTNFFGLSRVNGRESLSDFIVTRLRDGRELKLISDIYFSPLSIGTLMETVKIILTNPQSGTYNLGSHEGLSKSDFGVALGRALGLPIENAKIVDSSAFSFTAKRPKDMRMDVSLFERTFQIKLPSLSEEINKVRIDYEY